MNRRDRLIARVRQGYRLAFGTQGPEPRRFFAAPGRVNLIGEHVDYNDGYVLPCAINRETLVAAGSGPEIGGQGYVEAVAIDVGQAREKIPLYTPIQRTEDSWRNLIRGAIAFLQSRGHTILPTRLAIAGDIPVGAGLSSSASFAVGVTLALAQLSRVPLAADELAKVAKEAENAFLGTACGIMDPMACAASSMGSALLLDCRSLEHMPIPVSKKLSLVVVDSGIRRELASSAFNTRRRESEAAARHFGVRALRDLTMEAFKADCMGLDPTLVSRARHVVSEIARVEPTAVALAKGDAPELSRLMRASHISLRDDYKVTVPEVDQLVDTIWASLGEGEDALGGVRMTGAGFGGSVVAVVRKSAVDQVFDAVSEGYNSTSKIPATSYEYTLAGGAREVTPA